MGWSPEVAVMAAEKRFEWITKIILSRGGDGPFGIVEEDYVWKKRIPEAWCCSLAHAPVVQTRDYTGALYHG